MQYQPGLSIRTDAVTYRLLNEWQRDFPLTPRPFAVIAEKTGVTEATVLEIYRNLHAEGIVGRVGPVFAPHRLGTSALAALSAPPERLHDIAERVNREQAINHNYQREHAFNLWFVITASSSDHLHTIVEGIEADTGCDVIVLPLEEEFHIDLGFDLGRHVANGTVRQRARPVALPRSKTPVCRLSDAERHLVSVLQGGLPLVKEPFAASGARAGMGAADVLKTVGAWLESGVIRRFGVVVRHHELGLNANAMCVWDIPDEQVTALGKMLAAEPAVTLCYRRRRVLPHWPYNLFCMIHGVRRSEVLAARNVLAAKYGLDGWPHDILFSCRRFKQTGAHYIAAKEGQPA